MDQRIRLRMFLALEPAAFSALLIASRTDLEDGNAMARNFDFVYLC